MAEIEFLGKTFGDWKVLSKCGTDKYTCICTTCGVNKDIRGYYLKTSPPKCKHNDILGKTFGKLTVVAKLDNGMVKCMCSCGNTEPKIVHRRYLQNGTTTSCGCTAIGKTSKLIDITGKTFGNWKVTGYLGDKFWECKCTKCGNEKRFRGHVLRNNTFDDCRHTGREPAMIKTFGDWTVIDRVPGTTKWLCECTCGNKKEVEAKALLSGTSKSCGHATTGLKDLTGQTFGNWKVLRKSPVQIGSRVMWECECQCKNHTIRDLDSYVLRNGISKSCGCLTEQLRVDTTLEKYGVKYSSQIGTSRTSEQLAMVDTRESLIKTIQDYFINKPKTRELASLVGLDRASMMGYIHKYNIEEYIDIGNKPVSWYEEELLRIFPGAIQSDRTILNGKEIDLLYSDVNIGIEFNGTYWHSDLKKDKMYHQYKSALASNKGIHLIHVFEYEWNNTEYKDKLLKYLRRVLDRSYGKVITARECIVQEIYSDISDDFIDRFHLQGKSSAAINLGCYYNNTLIGVMTFGKPRFNSQYEYEIIRLCWMDGIKVVGGAQKLFKHFIRIYNPESIISYCDIAKFNGNVYESLGFKLNGISEPNYKWVDIDTNKILTRYQTQKARLIKAGLGTEDQTEDEIMHGLGYLKVYDCGNKVFLWTNTNNGGEE